MINRDHTEKIHCFIVPIFFGTSLRFRGSSKYHFGALVKNKKSRDADEHFTWESFLRVATVIFWLDLNFGNNPNDHLDIHLNDLKTRFLPFSMCSIIVASRRIYHAETWCGEIQWPHRCIRLLSAVTSDHLAAHNLLRPWSCCMCRYPKTTSKR
jgi:hypothetical protein